MMIAHTSSGGSEGASSLRRTRTLADYLAAARRRRTAMFITFLTVLLGAAAAALFWPPTYRSTGTILIEQQEIPTEYVRAAVTSFADQRVQMIGQRVMTSGNLLQIINKFDLYAFERANRPREVVLDRMRHDIRVSMISADVVDPRQGRATKATIAFSVSYDGTTPETAALVANEITSLYLRENLETRQRLASGSASFLDDEAQRIGKRVADLGQSVAEFKAKHGESLPEFSQMNVQLMNRNDDDLRDVETRLRSLEQQLQFLDSQLTQIDPDSPVYSDGGTRVMSSADRLKVLRTQLASAKAVYGPDHPDIVRLQQQIAGLDGQVRGVDTGADLRRQIEDTRTQLAAARERYADGHPDVQRLQMLLASTERELAALPAAQAPAPATPVVPDNPLYIQMKTQREATANERDSLLRTRASLQAKARELEQRFALSPGVERDYAALVRDLQGEQLKYAEVRQKQMEAQLGSNLESESKGERFQLIEPPIPPQKPTSPDRALILILGSILALAAAVGAMLALESLDGRVRGRDDVIALLSVPPLAMIPFVLTSLELRSRRRTWRYAALGAAGGVAAAALLVHVFYRPLDLLWLSTVRRLG
jgi:uncharacterized protein involved in exopolysaccharide biosynthesis